MSRVIDSITQPELRPLLDTIVSLIDRPSAIVADGDDVLASNERWRRHAIFSDESAKYRSLKRCFHGFWQASGLAETLQRSHQIAGVTAVRRDAGRPENDGRRCEYELRWRQIQIQTRHNSLAIVTLHDISESEERAPIMDLQQARIDRLLVRQTLIEESERRRIGRALHDVVVQDLAQIRDAVCSSGITPIDSTRIITTVDRIIDEVRTLTFDLGPPVLEDLGLRPALQWLAEHLSDRYNANITIADDGNNPRLSTQTQTIVFRAVRELAINAAKHAPDAEIIISCVTKDGFVRIMIRDTGPGFDTARLRNARGGINNYGLLSVEQQIRGIGGAFDLVSQIGDGTRATITTPLEQTKGDRNGQQHNRDHRR